MSKKKFLILPILILAVVCKYYLYLVSHAFVTAGLTVSSEDLNWHLFQRKHISSHNDKIWLVETLGVWFAIYLFGIATLVMLMRIVSGKSSPASQTDPVYINTLNRIITNTIEQSVIFAGLYGPILFSGRDSMSRIGGAKTLAIASIFVVGRVLFGIGYVLGSITGISPFRSFGFATAVVLNVVLVSYHLGFDSF